MRNYYQILGVERTADTADIKKAFRSAASRTHPDKEGGTEDAFKEVYEAYDVLKDDTRRRQYDTYLLIREEQERRAKASHDGARYTDEQSAKAHQASEFKKEESKRRGSFMYRVRYGVAYAFYQADRVAYVIRKATYYIFNFLGESISAIFFILASIGLTMIGTLIALLVLFLLSFFGLVRDPQYYFVDSFILSFALGGSIMITQVVDNYNRSTLYVCRNKLTANGFRLVNRGLFLGALFVTVAYIFEWASGTALAALYAGGVFVSTLIHILRNWSKDVDLTQTKL